MKTTMNFPALEAFLAVVRSGSFTRAAELMGSEKAAVSRMVTRLESDLGVQLLLRSTRSLSMTDAGRTLFERGTAIVGSFAETRELLQQENAEPRGTLRLTAGEEFGQLAVSQWIGKYLQTYPSLRVEAVFTNRIMDVVNDGFDVAVRVGDLPDSTLKAARLGSITYGLYASRSYLELNAAPESVSDLPQRDFIHFGASMPHTLDLLNAKDFASTTVTPRLTVNNNLAVRDAVARGLGIGMLPCFQAAPLIAAGVLCQVLEGWTRKPAPVHLVYPDLRYMPRKLRLFIDLATAEFRRAAF
jgi:LysR family transcriptional regulator, regulator for bpeEF and oprC